MKNKRSVEWISLAEKVWEVRKLRKKYEDEEGELLDRLKELSEDESCKGGGYIFERSERSGTINYSIIPFLQGQNLEPYRKPASIMWKLSKD